MTGSPERKPLKLLVFGADAAEASQIRRMRSYLACGFEVTGFMMRRANMNRAFEPFWDNVHLFETPNENPAYRAATVAGSIAKLRAHRAKLAGADVIIARNLDMLAVAAAARRMISPRPALIYECLDIHRLMTDGGRKGRLMRSAERHLLKETDMILVSSPAFLREYFQPVQHWAGRSCLVENKLWIDPGGPERPAPDPGIPEDWSAERPLRLGWVGSLRCRPSLELLAEVADRLGPRIRIEMHGIVHRHAVPDFDETVAARPNMIWHGPYDYPQGLAEIYRGCDLVWSQDLWQWGTNSTWLLPNRIYEASYFGCPSVAVDGTETGRRVADGLGWTIAAPDAEALAHLLERLSPAEIRARRDALLGQEDLSFRHSTEEIAAAIRQPLIA
ncbi:glycosyltransferase family 4 protein [Poseidonocella sp. HB161398]|uniref:glycosyltransferase family 4 protein n=1 Tax=Poseidonocella sp. HB161398 TaxID=2320855 RepID=UPI001108154E|nr:glycosyltransferase family 4 protein [Poseidonocella sp. HB161398]